MADPKANSGLVQACIKLFKQLRPNEVMELVFTVHDKSL